MASQPTASRMHPPGWLCPIALRSRFAISCPSNSASPATTAGRTSASIVTAASPLAVQVDREQLSHQRLQVGTVGIGGGDLQQRAALADHDDVEAAFTAYETLLFPRSEEAAEQSAAGMELSFAPDAPKGLVEQMQQWSHEMA